MSTIRLSVVKELSCDVLVVGGGCAGLSAAVCSARHGAHTILADMNGNLGGTATSGLVGPFMTCSNPDGTVQLIRGFFDEFVTRMEEKGGAIHPMKMPPQGGSLSAYRTRGHNNCTPFSAETYKLVAEEVCRESGVELLYHAMFIQSETVEGEVKAAYFATKAGVYKVTAKVFIDCSGDADLAYASGVPTIYGDNGDEVQATTLFFTIRGVDKDKLDSYMLNMEDQRKKFFVDEILAEREAGNYPSYRSKIQFFETVNGVWLVNMTQMDDVNGLVPEEVTAAEVEGRRQIHFVMSFLKKYVPGCENIELVASASNLGVRETRRIIGEHIVTQDDAVNGVRYEDSVFCCASSLDLHKKGYVHYIPTKEDHYFISYRALLPLNVSNMLVAGRCASTERTVMGAIRVMPPCFAMGQAAGTAAAIAAKAGISPKAIDTKELVNTLIADGVYLPEK